MVWCSKALALLPPSSRVEQMIDEPALMAMMSRTGGASGHLTNAEREELATAFGMSSPLATAEPFPANLHDPAPSPAIVGDPSAILILRPVLPHMAPLVPSAMDVDAGAGAGVGMGTGLDASSTFGTVSTAHSPRCPRSAAYCLLPANSFSLACPMLCLSHAHHVDVDYAADAPDAGVTTSSVHR